MSSQASLYTYKIFSKISILIFILLFLFAGCKESGENKVTTELIKPVQVSISGNVINKETSQPIDGLTVKVEARDYNGLTVTAAPQPQQPQPIPRELSFSIRKWAFLWTSTSISW